MEKIEILLIILLEMDSMIQSREEIQKKQITKKFSMEIIQVSMEGKQVRGEGGTKHDFI